MKTLLEVGDKIKRWEVSGEVDITYEVISVTKTLAKLDHGDSFYRELDYNVSKPKDNYVAEVKRKYKSTTGLGKRYFLIERL